MPTTDKPSADAGRGGKLSDGDLVERISAWAARGNDVPTEGDVIEAFELLGEAHEEILRLRRNASEFEEWHRKLRSTVNAFE